MDKANVETRHIQHDFNPYYDSHYLISRDDDDTKARRYLVELYRDELLKLRDEINTIIND